MPTQSFKCAQCGERVAKPSSAVNRARREGMRLFCDRKCAGLGRRKYKPKAQKIAEKRAYDMEYRRKNAVFIKAHKAAYHQRTYDPVAAAKARAKRMPQHVEYCRRPEYRAWKKKYDRQHNAKAYGPFAEAWMLSVDLNREIKGVMSNAQIKQENGTNNKTLRRARAEAQDPARYRARASHGHGA